MAKSKRTTSTTKKANGQQLQEAETPEGDQMDYEATNDAETNMVATRRTRRGTKYDEHNDLLNAQVGMEKVTIDTETNGVGVYEDLANCDNKVDLIRSQMAQYLVDSRAQKAMYEGLHAGVEEVKKGLSDFTNQLSEGVTALQRIEKTVRDAEAAAVLRDQKVDKLRKDLKYIQAKIDAEIEVTTQEDELAPAPEPLKPVKTPKPKTAKPKAKKETKIGQEAPGTPAKVVDLPTITTVTRLTRAQRAENRAALSEVLMASGYAETVSSIEA